MKRGTWGSVGARGMTVRTMAIVVSLAAALGACSGDTEPRPSGPDVAGDTSPDVPGDVADAGGDAGADVAADAAVDTDTALDAPDGSDVDTDTDAGDSDVADSLAAVITSLGTVYVGVPVVLDGSESSGAGELTFAWTASNGLNSAASSDESVSTVFTDAGTQEVMLTVSDGVESATATTSFDVVWPDASLGEAEVRGVVRDTEGYPVRGAAIEDATGFVLGRSDASGAYTAVIPAGVPVGLRVSASSFTDNVIRAEAAVDTTVEQDVVLMRRAVPTLLDDAAEGGDIVGRDRLRITFPPASLVDAESGEPVTGPVTVVATNVDMEEPLEALAFPGAFDGVTEGAEFVPIASLGVMEVELSQGGRAVQVAPDSRVTVEIPVASGEPGDIVPMWSLDERTGVWMQEGTGEVADRDGSLVLVAEVSHFSWWNADVVASGLFSPVTLSLEDPDGAPFTMSGSREVTVTGVNHVAPVRHFNRRIRLEAGRQILDAALVLPNEGATDVEVIAWDGDLGTLWYGLAELAGPFEAEPADFVVAEVGSDALPVTTLADGEDLESFVWANGTDTAFYRATLEEDATTVVTVNAEEEPLRVIVRRPDGAVLQELFAGDGSPAVVALDDGVANEFLIQLVSANRVPGSATIGQRRVEEHTIRPGESVVVPLGVPVGATFRIQGDTRDGAYARVNDSELSYWRSYPLAPNGRELGTFESLSAAYRVNATFEPMLGDLNGYFTRITGARADDSTRDDMEVAFYRTRRMNTVQGPGPATETFAEIGGPENGGPFEIHRYDLLLPPDHRAYVHVQRLVSPVDPSAPERLEDAWVRLSSNGRDLAEQDLDVGMSYAMYRPPFHATEPAVVQVFVSFPDGETGAYRIVTEIVRTDVATPPGSELLVGDCDGADFRFLDAAYPVGRDTELTLCPASETSPHILMRAIRGSFSVSGAAGSAPEDTVVATYGSGAWTSVEGAGDDGALVHVRRLRILPHSVLTSVVRTEHGASATVEDVVIERVPNDESALSHGPVFSSRASDSDWQLRRVDVRAGERGAVAVSGNGSVTIEDSTFQSDDFFGVSVQSSNGSMDVHVEDSEFVCGGWSNCLFIEGLGVVTIRGNTLVNESPGNENTVLLELRTDAFETAWGEVHVENNVFSLAGDYGLGMHLQYTGANTGAFVENNRFEMTLSDTPSGVSRPFRIDIASGSVVNIDLDLFNNVITGFQSEPEIADIQAYRAVRIHHNSVYSLRRDFATWPIFELHGYDGDVSFHNNALVSGTSALGPALSAPNALTIDAQNNLVWNVAATPLAGTGVTATGTVVADPLWDAATLVPGAGSPLIDAGATLEAPLYDVDGATRPSGVAPDIGAFELP